MPLRPQPDASLPSLPTLGTPARRPRQGRWRGKQGGAAPGGDTRHPALPAIPCRGRARRAAPPAPPLLSAQVDGRAGTTDGRSAFPDWRFAPNIGGHPDVYEMENRALDPDGHVLAAIRNLAPWTGRRIAALGCGTGFRLPGHPQHAPP